MLKDILHIMDLSLKWYFSKGYINAKSWYQHGIFKRWFCSLFPNMINSVVQAFLWCKYGYHVMFKTGKALSLSVDVNLTLCSSEFCRHKWPVCCRHISKLHTNANLTYFSHYDYHNFIVVSIGCGVYRFFVIIHRDMLLLQWKCHLSIFVAHSHAFG